MSEYPNDKERIDHMIKAIDRIFSFTQEISVDDFYSNEMVQYAVIKNLEIIGEAANKISAEARALNLKIEWRKIIAFRHILVHDYYIINLEIVWNAIENKLFDLKIELENMKEHMS